VGPGGFPDDHLADPAVLGQAPGWELVLASFVMAPAIHQLVTLVGFLIGARRRAI
jgi:hypothetical protein